MTTHSAYEDAEQARTLAHQPVTLPYDSRTGLVIAGPWADSDVGPLVEAMMLAHLQAGRDAVFRLDFVRPWWRFWKRTPVVRITVRAGQ